MVRYVTVVSAEFELTCIAGQSRSQGPLFPASSSSRVVDDVAEERET